MVPGSPALTRGAQRAFGDSSRVSGDEEQAGAGLAATGPPSTEGITFGVISIYLGSPFFKETLLPPSPLPPPPTPPHHLLLAECALWNFIPAPVLGPEGRCLCVCGGGGDLTIGIRALGAKPEIASLKKCSWLWPLGLWRQLTPRGSTPTPPGTSPSPPLPFIMSQVWITHTGGISFLLYNTKMQHWETYFPKEGTWSASCFWQSYTSQEAKETPHPLQWDLPRKSDRMAKVPGSRTVA